MLEQRRTDVWSDSVFAYYGTGGGPFAQEGLTTSDASHIDKQWAMRIEDLLRIRLLRDNWDGEDAPAPAPEVIDSVLELFPLLRTQAELPPPNRIVPSREGGIVIEWQFDPDHYLEAECSEPYRAEWMLEIPDAPTAHWPQNWGPLDESSLRAA